MDNEQIASMKAEKQAIQAEQNEQKKRGDTPSADGYARIRELDQGIGEAEHSRSVRMEEQSRLRGENARTKEEIGRIDALSARARSAISPSRSVWRRCERNWKWYLGRRAGDTGSICDH